MKLQTDMTINGKEYKSGDELSAWAVYPFFLLHSLMFGASGFFMAYTDDGPPFIFMVVHGGFAIFVYLLFYSAMFGKDAIRWMFINAGLGMLGIYAEINWLLSFFGTTAADYSVYRHIIPFLYYVLYTFLIRQAVLDITRSRDNETRRKTVETLYVVGSICVYGLIYFFT